jgi:hypothetical protein
MPEGKHALQFVYTVPGLRARLREFRAKIAALKPEQSALAARLCECLGTALANYDELAAEHLDRMASAANFNVVTRVAHCVLVAETHALGVQLTALELAQWQNAGAVMLADFRSMDTLLINGICVRVSEVKPEDVVAPIETATASQSEVLAH